MADQATLITVASLIAAFGGAILVFRIQREAAMQSEGESTWIPWADRLILAATLLALSLGVFPAVSGLVLPSVALSLSMAANSGAVVLLFGYVLAILAHYRLLLGRGRKGARANPEPAERWITWLTAVVALLIFGIVGCRSLGGA